MRPKVGMAIPSCGAAIAKLVDSRRSYDDNAARLDYSGILPSRDNAATQQPPVWQQEQHVDPVAIFRGCRNS